MKTKIYKLIKFKKKKNVKIGHCEQCYSAPLYGWGNMVILPNKLWLSIADMEESLCTSCIEKRLKRKLTLKDFPKGKSKCFSDDRKIPLREIYNNVEFFWSMGWLRFK